MEGEAQTEVDTMKILNIAAFAAACLVIYLLASQNDPGAALAWKDPNPMKGNERQFARMQQTEPIQFASK
jgi:hypothetical protein